ncbi:hypothetical protein BY458DRAFT_528924 [Sporodiniella umbellata]|nr:hypothetical protein BY458DRAFT_528924 [Sporodiniella umbellata]
MLERKKSTKIKSLFRSQEAVNSNRKAAGQLKISSPVIQHSTSIYSLVSPIRTSFAPHEHPMPSPLGQRQQSEMLNGSRTGIAASTAAIAVERYTTEKQPSNRRHSCSSTLNYNDGLLIPPPAPKSTFYNKLRDRRRSHTKSGSSSAAASVTNVEPSTSKSTPLLQKVKKYNLDKKKASKDELEKLRKTRELEDLITGRRGSTVKLTLTPKGL